jgi:hypothetical protein
MLNHRFWIAAISLGLGLAGMGHRLDAAWDDPGSDVKAIEGLWHGSWGGGEVQGTVYQPVLAELWIRGDQVELVGFRGAPPLIGTATIDESARRLRITPKAERNGPPAPKALDYTYELKADQLDLIGDDSFAITLHRRPVVESPLADVQVEFVAADGIDDAGNLQVTRFGELRAGSAGTILHEPRHESLKTEDAVVFLARERDLKKIRIEKARGLIRERTPVVVAYRRDDRQPLPRQHELWSDEGPAAPDGEAVSRTVARMVRPGTLIFVLSARKNVVEP